MAWKSLKKLFVAVIILGAILLCALLLVASMQREGVKTEPIVSGDEYDFYAEMERAQVSAWFFQAHNVELGSDRASWERSYDGDSPAQMLNQQVNDQAGYDQAMRTMALRYDVSPMPAFDEMNTQLEEFNQQRQEGVDSGGVIYGPTQYGLLEYYLTLRSEAETALVGAILNDALKNKEPLLRERYEMMSSEELTRRRTARLMLYVIEPEEFSNHLEKAMQAQQMILTTLEQDAETPLETLTTQAGLPIGSKELLLDSGTLSREDSFSAQILAQAVDCGAGKCFVAPLTNGSEYTCIYQVLELGTGEHPTFEDAEMTVAAQYANEVFEREMAEQR